MRPALPDLFPIAPGKFEYKNGFYDWDRPSRNSDPAVYTVSVKPTEHRGFLIFERIPKRCFDLVKDGICIGQIMSRHGCELLADKMLDQPDDRDAARSHRILARAKLSRAA